MPGRFLAEARGFTAMELVLAASASLIILAAVYTTLVSTRGTYDAGESRAEIQQQGRVAAEMLTRELRLVGYGFPVPENPPLPDCDADGLGDNAVLAATPTSITFCADVKNASTTIVNDVAAGDGNFDVVDASGIRGKGGGKGAVGDNIFLMAGGTWEQIEANSVNTTVNPDKVSVDVVANDYSAGIPVGRPKAITYSWTAGALWKDDSEGGGLQILAEGIQNFELQYFDGSDAEITPANLAANLANIRRIWIEIQLQSGPGSLGTQNFTITSNVRLRNL